MAVPSSGTSRVIEMIVQNKPSERFLTCLYYLRAFQGWMSLSHSRPGTGTLRVLPLLKESTAYWILRPFLPDVPKDLFPGIENF
jgi:hypothetical protein